MLGVTGQTYSFFDLTEFLELGSQGHVVSVPGKASASGLVSTHKKIRAARRRLADGVVTTDQTDESIEDRTETYPMKSLDMVAKVDYRT